MKATTSLTVAEFETLAKEFAPLWAGLQAEQTAVGTPRQRQPGGGRKSLLATAELKLFFVLFYYKAYPSQGRFRRTMRNLEGSFVVGIVRIPAASSSSRTISGSAGTYSIGGDTSCSDRTVGPKSKAWSF